MKNNITRYIDIVDAPMDNSKAKVQPGVDIAPRSRHHNSFIWPFKWSVPTPDMSTFINA